MHESACSPCLETLGVAIRRALRADPDLDPWWDHPVPLDA